MIVSNWIKFWLRVKKCTNKNNNNDNNNKIIKNKINFKEILLIYNKNLKKNI